MSNKKINVTRREFLESYRNHYKLYCNTTTTESPKTRRLISFYAVECGLKSLIMKQTGNNTFQQLEQYCQTNPGKKLAGHDIRAMIREANPKEAFILRDIRLKNGGGSVPPNRFNELWRYGPEVEDSTQEDDAEKILIKIADWLKTII